MKRVVVHIDRLVLQGFQSRDRRAIAAGLETQLARALVGVPADSFVPMPGKASHIDAGSVHFAHGAGPLQVGAGVAQRVAGKMTR